MEFLLALLILLLFAKGFGELFHHYGFSPLIAEVTAGIVLGPALLGLIPLGDVTPGSMLEGVAMLGLVVMMLVAGMNSRFDLLVKVRTKAIIIALCGVSLSFALGFLALYALGVPLLASLFVGAALANTSTDILARITGKHPLGQLIVSAALIDDIMAVYIVGILSASVRGGLDPSVVLLTTAGIIVFFLAIAIASRELIIKRNVLRKLWRFEERGVPIAFALCLALTFAVIAHNIGLHAIIGAYMAGLFISRLRERPVITLQSRIRLNAMLDDITTSFQSILTPMFFVFVGLSFGINPATGAPLNWGQISLLVLAVLIVVAFAGKFIGCSLGAMLTGYKKDRVAIGVAMCSRGALELAILHFGLRAMVVPHDLFATMVVVVLILIITTPILFKYASRGKT
jgi:Kef-type K+ transport system membrane component KefB